MDIFACEEVQLQDRVGRPLTLEVACRYYRQRYALIVASPNTLPAQQLAKNAEHIAYQLVQRLELDPVAVDFLHYRAAPSPLWRRWRFRWAGSSPLLVKDEQFDAEVKAAYLQRLLQDGQPLSLAAESAPANVWPARLVVH